MPGTNFHSACIRNGFFAALHHTKQRETCFFVEKFDVKIPIFFCSQYYVYITDARSYRLGTQAWVLM